ncbi:MAG: zf-HC2 domain-containing protein, partial [Pseudorhodobacter sp.]|nr:zf-HC2 domain-containing protein [Frankiaceae bacterium]
MDGRAPGGRDVSGHLGPAVTALVDGELGHERREQVLAHLAHCSPCRVEV